MYTKQPKKLLIMNILDILRTYSDADHRLSQKDILDILRRDYDMVADRKAIKRNLMNLIDFGYSFEYTERVRRNKSGEEEILYTDWYLVRDFTDAELRLLIDSLLFSKHIPPTRRKDLIAKIERLSNRHFQSRMGHVHTLPADRLQNSELFYNIEILDEAIEKNRQVTFHYGDFGTDKGLHLRTGADGKPTQYLVNPYQMVAANGKYYLIGNMDAHDNVSHYRLDRIRDITPTLSPAKPQRKVKGLENGLDLPQHMSEHVYMFSGESCRITMRTSPNMAGNLIDWFGDNITFTNETADSVIAHVTANVEAMRYWALQYALNVTILSPKSLVEQVKADLAVATARYNGGCCNE